MPVIIRGVVDAPDPGGAFTLVVAIADRPGGDHRVDVCWLHDTALPPATPTLSRTPIGVNSETAIDLSGHLRPGRNAVGCRIGGQGTAFDLDVYEIRRPAGPG
jgi:hypothetical protein